MDSRKRAMARLAVGASVRRIATALDVAPPSVVKWSQRLCRTGSRGPASRRYLGQYQLGAAPGPAAEGAPPDRSNAAGSLANHDLHRGAALRPGRCPFRPACRLYKDESLQVRTRKRRELPRRDRVAPQVPERPMQRWSLDCVSDQFADCRRARLLNIDDDRSRFHPGQIVDISISGARLHAISTNRTSKEATVKCYRCECHERLRSHLVDFMAAWDFARRHSTLSGLTPYKLASKPGLEARIEKLERQKIVLAERVETTVPPKGRLEDCIELALNFLSNPWNIYKNGDFAMRQTVLRLVFAEPLIYGQNGAYGTPEFSFPFKYLRGLSGAKSGMVLPERFELSTSPLPRECSTPELRQQFRPSFRGGEPGPSSGSGTWRKHNLDPAHRLR